MGGALPGHDAAGACAVRMSQEMKEPKMTRFPRFAASLAGAAILLAGGWALAQQARAPGQPANPAQPVQPQIPALPGFWQLRMESVQKDLELVPEQIEKLKQIGKEYYEDLRAQRAQWKDWGKLTQEERMAKYKEMREKQMKRAEAVRKQVEKVLLPHQLKALEEMNFRRMASSMLYQPRVMQNVGITEEQKAKIQKIRQEMMDKYQKLQKESLDQILKLLTPEQQQKLREQVRSYGRRRY
jgi:Spy/CpxP family protein refolding chaperone